MRRLWRCAIPTNPPPVIFAGGVASPPRIYEVTPNHGADTGGTSVTIRGQGFTGASRVKFSNSLGFGSDSFVVVDDFTITATTPADLLDELVKVWVVTPNGTASKAGAFKFDATAFDPTSLPFNLALRGSYAGAPWAGTATAGTSGSWNGASSGVDPTVGRSVCGFTPAVFDGSTTTPILPFNGASYAFFSDFASPSEYYFGTLVYLESAPADISGGTAPYLNPCIIADNGGAMGIGVSSSGVQGFHDDGGTYAITGWAPLSLNEWHWVEWWYDGSNIHIAVDGVQGTPSPATATASYETLESVRIGTNYSGVSIDGAIQEIWGAPTDLSAHSADMIAYTRTRYFSSTFDPATLPLDAFLRGDYPGSGN